FLAQGDRYERARTFLATAIELWDSWHGDEILADQDTGQFLGQADPGTFRHRDAFFDIAGQFNVPRSPQGRPVIFQAGDSDVDGPLPDFDPVVSDTLISQGRASVRQFAKDPVALAAEWRARAEAGNLSATVLEAVDGYRAAFQPSAELDRPYVSVSADVVVA